MCYCVKDMEIYRRILIEWNARQRWYIMVDLVLRTKCDDVLIFGTDRKMQEIFIKVFENPENAKACGIRGFVSNVKEGNLYGMPVHLVNELSNVDFSKIVIVNGGNYSVQRDELIYGYQVPPEKVEPANYLIRLRVLQKYQNEENYEETLSRIRSQTHFDLWCGYCPKPREKYEVQWDESTNMPFVFFCGKRLYYPREKKFTVKDGKQYVYGLEFEQQTGSPHTYVTEKICVREGDVIVDAGVCEGNFSIRYIEMASKVYLIESNPIWRYPLELTFRDYLHKVVFCNKFLSDKDAENSVSLDSLIGNQRVDFIKMDIEGAEPLALQGGSLTFKNNRIRCSICSYHRHGDENRIKSLLKSYGYQVENSVGHMIFPYDPERFNWSELRHGITYGYKL